ncbi:MAG: hypothetical protein CMM01_04595 [Rhodopirellula sp.]|nr:hypothetical protein [Rhodopirellula sp.]
MWHPRALYVGRKPGFPLTKEDCRVTTVFRVNTQKLSMRTLQMSEVESTRKLNNSYLAGDGIHFSIGHFSIDAGPIWNMNGSRKPTIRLGTNLT